MFFINGIYANERNYHQPTVETKRHCPRWIAKSDGGLNLSIRTERGALRFTVARIQTA